MKSVVEAKDLKYGTPDGRVLAQGLSFNLASGDLLLLSGQNGSGKSTLLKVVLDKVNSLAGTLKIHVPRERIAILPQVQNNEFHLPLTLKDLLDISLGRKVRKDEIARVGLLDDSHLDLPWNTASGGERKRALLTRILLQSPSLLLLDEPMNHLDQDSRTRMLNAVLGYLNEAKASNRQSAVILVSHEKSIHNRLSEFPSLQRIHLGALSESELEE